MIVDFDEIRHYFKLLKEYDFTKRFQDYLLMILDLERRFNEFKTGMESKLQIILPKVCDIKNGLKQWGSQRGSRGHQGYTNISGFIQFWP